MFSSALLGEAAGRSLITEQKVNTHISKKAQTNFVKRLQNDIKHKKSGGKMWTFGESWVIID